MTIEDIVIFYFKVNQKIIDKKPVIVNNSLTKL